MPVYIAAHGLFDGIGSIPYVLTVLKILPWLLALYVLKIFFGGARNTSERNMHSKVIMMTVSFESHRRLCCLANCNNREVHQVLEPQ